MKKLIIILLTILPLLSISQNESPIKLSWHGFIKSDYWWDMRKVAGAREDLFALYPLNEDLDKNGNDINDQSSFNYSAITSRLNVGINGPDAFGAKTFGFIEADFSGQSNADINGFRLRHAFLKLSWDKTDLLFGQFWHPMFVTECFPTVVSLNTGAPFNPFIRSPQVRMTYKLGNVNLIGALLSQRDYMSNGPNGPSTEYIRNAGIPNGHIQLQFKNDNHVAGIGADYKLIQPRTLTDSNIIQDELMGSFALMGYYKYTKDKLTFKTKAIYGQNLIEHLLVGGYAVENIDTTTLKETYTPINHFYVWGNLVYGKKVKFGLFGGYTKNLGAGTNTEQIFYGRGLNMDHVYRVAPSVSFVSGKTQISTEVEYTSVAYGTPDIQGNVKNTKDLANVRLLMTFFYFF